MHRLLDNITGVSLIQPILRGTSAETTLVTTGTSVDLAGEGRKVLVALSCGAVGTGTNTLSVVIQESADDSSFTTLYSFAEVGTTGTTAVDLTPAKRYIRAVCTIRSTNSINITFGVYAAVYNERGIPSNVA